MVIASSTRPPTSGEVPSVAEGEAVLDVPIADVADWGEALAEDQPTAAAPEAAVSPPSMPASMEGTGSLAPPPYMDAVGTPSMPPLAEVTSAPSEPPPLPSSRASPGVSGGRSWTDFPALSSLPVLERPAPVEPLPEVDDSSASVIVDPAQITAHRSSQPLPGANTPPPGTPLPVLLLVDQAQGATGEERQELSRRINRWLDKMAREGGSRHVADWFHHLIESSRLEGLADAAGNGCHETAVQGLLAMGFPYALEVRPEDLERIKPRESQRKHQRRGRRLKGAAAGVVVGGTLGEVVLNLLRTQQVTGILTVEVGVAALALVALAFSQPRTPLRNMGLAVLLVGSLFSFFLGVMGGYAGLVSGLAGLVAALLFALHRS